MSDTPSNLLNFSCQHCSTVLTVPVSMAGVSGPCPSCQTPVMAPHPQPAPAPAPVEPISAPPAAASAPEQVAPAVSIRRARRSRKPLAYAVLLAATVGVAWSVKHFLPAGETSADSSAVSASGQPSANDPKARAIGRSTEFVKKFLSCSNWEIARKMIAEQDTPGSTPDNSFQPARFLSLATEGKFHPVSITTKENADQFQIVWEIESPSDSERLVVTVDESPEGGRIRWYQPPYFVASSKGSNASAQQVVAQITSPLAAPTTPPAEPTPAPEETTPTPKPAPEETILAATEAATATPTQGSAPLNNTAAKVKPEANGTAAVTVKKAEAKHE